MRGRMRRRDLRCCLRAGLDTSRWAAASDISVQSRAEGLPSYLQVVGEVLMGRAPDVTLVSGQCARIATGGMLPPGANAVVMVEQTQEVGADTVEALRPVAP